MERGRGSLLVPETINHAQEARGSETREKPVSVLERCAVFAMTFGPGSAIATYTTLFGWYQNAYRSKEVLVWMRMALFAPFPVVQVLQQRYDKYFDELFSTRTAYFFRIVVMQLVVATLMVIWMFLPVAISELAPVVGFGVVLGACCAPFIGSSMQIAVAIDPILSVFAQLGNNVGMIVPVIAVNVLGFSPSSSHADMCKVLVVPMVICILTSVWLGSLHFAETFGNAFRVMTQRRASTSQSSEQITNSQADVAPPSPDDALKNVVVASESKDADIGESPSAEVCAEDTDPEEIPDWVWRWLAMQSVAVALDFFMLTLIGYFGDAHVTHHLASGTLVSAVMGRALAFAWRHLPGFQEGPLHFAAGMLWCARLACWASLVITMGGVWKPLFEQLLALWCLWNLCAMLHNAVTDLTVTSHVPESIRQIVAQYGIITTYSGLVVGLLTASSVVLMVDERSISAMVLTK